MDAEKSYKVWSCDREIRKSVIASNLNELRTKGAHKLGYESCQADELKLVLDSDGTEIEDEKCFQLADKDTVFLLLRADERWLPAGVEALKTGNASDQFHQISPSHSISGSIIREYDNVSKF